MQTGSLFRSAVFLMAMCCVASAQPQNRSTPDQQLYGLARTDLKAFAQKVSQNATSELGRAQAIVRWLAENFDWKATDYQKRTVQEIIERRGGNCNELAMVALAAMKELNIKLRRVHEVNIYTNTPERGERARQMVKDKGNTFSVFGRHHNDHVWLELYDSAANEWFPADPSSGLVGVDEWMKGRVWFGKRSTLNPITNDMIVPFAIFAADDQDKFTINRTQHYLVDEFDRLYGGRLHTAPAWPQWTAALDLLADKVKGAFAGEINLHEYETQIDSLAAIYEQLRASCTRFCLLGARTSPSALSAKREMIFSELTIRTKKFAPDGAQCGRGRPRSQLESNASLQRASVPAGYLRQAPRRNSRIAYSST